LAEKIHVEMSRWRYPALVMWATKCHKPTMSGDDGMGITTKWWWL
jgi:hypothetical protein